MARRQSVLLLALTAIVIAVGASLVHPWDAPFPGLESIVGASVAPSSNAPDEAELRAIQATAAAQASGLRVRIPAIEVDAPVIGLRADDDEARLPAPDAPSVVGMLSGAGATAGAHALLVGHLNWHTGEPAVFEHLTEVEIGDTVVLEQSGEERAYRVTSVRDVDGFTTSLEDVLGSGEQDTITLMTCTGEFLWNVGVYAERRVVLAVRAYS